MLAIDRLLPKPMRTPDAEVFEGPVGVIGTLTAHTTGEKVPLTMVEIHQVEDGMVRKIDVGQEPPRTRRVLHARRGGHPLTTTLVGSSSAAREDPLR
ncbi:hypothetical protein [Streptomyces cellulosae]|uniref:Uncharacterized protein n=1 Tax=Streptomyces cellulosae TaxID=1968 RepID=A0ABW7YGP5_STRCE